LVGSFPILIFSHPQKAYAQGAAIVGAAFGSWLIFDFIPSGLFAFGTFIVALSVYLYNAYPPIVNPPSNQQMKTLKEMLPYKFQKLNTEYREEKQGEIC
jgi:hypothetical protein